MVIFSESHLRSLSREFAAHYHEERNHQGLDNNLLCSVSSTTTEANDDPIVCNERLGRTTEVLSEGSVTWIE